MSSLYMLPSWDPLDISGGDTEENITKTGGSGRGGGEKRKRSGRGGELWDLGVGESW